MAVDVTFEQAIDRDRAAVAGFAMDPAHDARWIKALDSVNVLTDGAVGVGTQVERVASFLGKRMTYVNEIVEYDPPARLAMKSVKAPFPMTVVYEFDQAPSGGTVARIHTAGDASGFYKLTGPLLSAAVRRGVARDLRELKRVMETDGRRSSAASRSRGGRI